MCAPAEGLPRSPIPLVVIGGTGVDADAGCGMGEGTTPKDTVGTDWTDGTAATDGTAETELEGS